MNPDRMVIAEAMRTFTYLNLYGFLCDAVVVNRIFPEEVAGTYFGAWRDRQQEHLELVRGDATRLPMVDASVHRVLCFNSLHCIPHHREVLREFHRVLVPGGELVGTTLTADAPLPWLVNVRAAQLSGFFVPPDSRRLRADARAAGFERWETERTGALIFFRGVV